MVVKSLWFYDYIIGVLVGWNENNREFPVHKQTTYWDIQIFLANNLNIIINPIIYNPSNKLKSVDQKYT